jgi:hypothetical protein
MKQKKSKQKHAKKANVDKQDTSEAAAKKEVSQRIAYILLFL